MAQKPGPGGVSNEKNEYIPAFITKKPFWVPEDTDEADYLEHQRLKKAEEDSKWYDRGKRKGPAATKYRKGACENCGSMTHKARDCLSRPRAKGARWTGKDIQADEIVQDVRLGYDAKRDRWNGYDPSEYKHVVEEYEELEKLRKAAGGSKADKDAEDQNGQDARYTEESDMGRGQSTATRNLRMREDTAKYLLNLDLESARYDPKTRSMATGVPDDAEAAAKAEEEEFVRASGDAAEFEAAQRFAWETQERGGPNKIHIQANPTSGEFMRKKELEEAEARKEERKKQLLERYGEQSSGAKLRNTAVVENERFVEYDERGRVKGEMQGPAKSKYAEDVFTNNHTSVWGSWWHDFTWGYRCCHSTVKNSYCTGDAGREALEAEKAARTGDLGDDGGEKRPAEDDMEEAQKRQRTQ